MVTMQKFSKGGWPCNLAVLEGPAKNYRCWLVVSRRVRLVLEGKLSLACPLCLDHGKLARDRKRRLRKVDILILPLTGETVARIIQNH